MSKLEDFLGLSDITEVRKTIKIKIRDKVYDFVIRPLSEEENSEFQKRSRVSDKKGNVTLNSTKFSELIIDACIVEPDFKNSEFLSKVKCTDSIEFMKRKFPSGVFTELLGQIQTLSGFDSFESEIEEAKN